jgi:uncharacterized protein (TIGR02266 family)
MSQNRVSGFRECARKARDLLQPMVEREAAPDSVVQVHAAIEQAWGRLLTVDRSLELSEAEIRTHLTGAYDSLEKATGLLIAASSNDWPPLWSSRLAQARSLVFASGGSSKTVPPSRRSSTSMRAVSLEALAAATHRSESYPSLELGEIDVASLGDLGPELAELLYPQSAAAADDRSDWNILEVEVGLVGENNFFAGLSMDVSEGGVFVATYEPSPIGTNLMISFVLPDGHSVTTPGVVRFLIDARGDIPPGMGVSFADLAHEDLKAIRKFCKTRRPTYYEMD